MIQFFIEKLAYPLWVAKEGISGLVTKQARDACYWYMNTDTSQFGYFDKIKHQLEVSATCERVGDFLYSSKYVQPLQISGVMLAGGLLMNKLFRKEQYKGYIQKTPEQIQALTSNQKASFLTGVESSKGRLSRAVNLLRYNTYLHPRAFYAGFEAARKNNQELINAVKNAPGL